MCETERARGIYELAIAQPALDMPELLWKVCNLGLWVSSLFSRKNFVLKSQLLKGYIVWLYMSEISFGIVKRLHVRI